MPAVVVTAASLHGGGGDDDEFPSKITWRVVLCTFIASLGGFLFGYDLGISGGVTSMDEFLMEFFPNVYTKKHQAKENNYCKFNDGYLQFFTSSLYLAAIVASLVASFFSKKYGRRLAIRVASIFFLIGAIFNLAAQNLIMLILGRIFLGLGLGFGNQTVPLFISEIAPAKWRGGLNIMFQLLITIGILVANFFNFGFSHIKHNGWRISLGLAAVPAAMLFAGSFLIVDTPTSLMERGKKEEALRSLKKVRGVDYVEKEFEEIVQATEVAKGIKRNSFLELAQNPQNWPPLISAMAIQSFQQLTGMNVIMFYAPVLFQTMGFGGKAALLSAAITGLVNCLSTLISNFMVDRVGRRPLLLLGALIMFIGQCVVGGILMANLKSTDDLSFGLSIVVVIMICVFVSAFAWSWGPLGWLISSEIFPLETRNSGYFCAVATNMVWTFAIAQLFLTMLCHMRAGIFFFFAFWLAAMTISVYTMLPETKGIPIDEMAEKVWKQHWFWKKCYPAHEATGDKTKKVQLQKSSR